MKETQKGDVLCTSSHSSSAKAQPSLFSQWQVPTPRRINLLQVIAGTERVYSLAKEYKIKTAFGSDLLFSSKLTNRQGLMLTHLTRWYDNADILRMATSINAELLAMSGARNPYEGALGIIEETALADLLVVDGSTGSTLSQRRKGTS
jgi:imidazolonepropionase-like amidohydrolase